MQQSSFYKQYRKMFVAKPGWKLVDSDYSSAELFASLSLRRQAVTVCIEQGMTFTVTLHF
jgi:DNA polymerase I-like protein with 3'-5' exonuclease and polymerase domains